MLLVARVKTFIKVQKWLGSERYYPKKDIGKFLKALGRFSLCKDYSNEIRSTIKQKSFSSWISRPPLFLPEPI